MAAMLLDLRLAPMAGVTNAPFRLVARECGAGLLTSELIDALLPERLALVQLKKHLAWYASSLPRAAQTRPALFQAADAAAVTAIFWSLW